MPKCLDVMNQYGHHGNDVRSMGLPATLVDICPGDFLGSVTADSALVAKPISADVAWDTNLVTTQTAAKLVFQGVALSEISATDGNCNDAPTCIPYAKYRQGSGFTRAYKIVDAAGAAEPTTWVQGQRFSFGKNASSNLLSNNTIVKSSTAGAIVFRAVKDSGANAQAYAEVEFHGQF